MNKIITEKILEEYKEYLINEEKVYQRLISICVILIN